MSKNKQYEIRYQIESPSAKDLTKQTFVTTLAATVGTVAAMAVLGAAAAAGSAVWDKIVSRKNKKTDTNDTPES